MSAPDDHEIDPAEKFGGRHRRFIPRLRRRNEPVRKVLHASQPTASGDLEPAEIDIHTAHTSRVYDYLLGGAANFTVDREAAHHIFATYPGGIDGVRIDARANRAFLGRAVRWLVTEAGIRQFLDIGAGIPTEGNVHEVAQNHASDARIVYVDNDPIVLAHAHHLLEGTPDGATAYIDGDFREPDAVLKAAEDTLDFGQPVALMMVGLMHVIPDSYDPHGIIGAFLDALPSGSYMAISQLTTDLAPRDMSIVQERLEEAMAAWNPPALRPQAEVEAFFAGLDLVPPGVTRGDLWHNADPDAAAKSDRAVPLTAGLARKP
jgi:S-adenosyl methyltransferase